jgi:DNA-binding NarL/FixJ family response regulator
MSEETRVRLLVAEDHPAMRRMIVNLLLGDFDVVASVRGGPSAIEAANKLRPDLLVLDVAMPLMDGTEVAKTLKRQGSKAKIIFLSVSDSADQVASCIDAGADAFVTKMRMVTDLRLAIDEVLAGRSFFSPAEN